MNNMADETKKKKRKTYTKEEIDNITNNIFKQIEEKNMSVRQIFNKENKDKPEINQDTFYVWLSKYDDVAERYARACELRADSIFDEIFTISDMIKADMVEVQNARLQIDSRKWALGKMMPTKYGDKIEINGNLRSEVTNHNIDYSKLSDETLRDILKNIQKND